MSIEVVARGGRGLGGIAVDGDGRIFGASTNDGRVLQPDEEGRLVEFAQTGGSPTGVATDRLGNVYVSDAAHGAVLLLRDDGSSQVVVREYESTPLRGPHSLVFDAAGSCFFTDAGPLGDTGLHSATGSVFVISGEANSAILRPLALRCLARPTGIALSGNGAALFVAEAAANRVLRFTQKPAGVWHAAVFHTFAGRLGPSALAYDAARNLLYVARPEAPELSDRGVISVLSPEGALVREFAVPGAPQVSGLALSADATRLYVADGVNTVFAVVL